MAGVFVLGHCEHECLGFLEADVRRQRCDFGVGLHFEHDRAIGRQCLVPRAAEIVGMPVCHYAADFEAIADVTGQPVRAIAPLGSLRPDRSVQSAEGLRHKAREWMLSVQRLNASYEELDAALRHFEGLNYIQREEGHIAIGALTRHHDLATSDVLQRDCPIVADAASTIGDPQVRHMGTIAGSIAHADPASDLPTVMVALDAIFVIRGMGGVERRVAAVETKGRLSRLGATPR